MINENTIATLNKIGFGADIDSLESYIIDYKQARLLSNLAFYANEYKRLVKILKEIKPSSQALSNKTELIEEDTDIYDRLLNEHRRLFMSVAYGAQNQLVHAIKDNISSNFNNCTDLVGIANIDGINVRCSYINGNLYRINCIGEEKKYLDITELLRNKVPSFLEDFKNIKLAELRGKITLFNNADVQFIEKNIPCSVMRCIRTKINIDSLKIVITDVIVDKNSDFEYNTQWDRLEHLRDLGISVPHYVLVRDVDSESISDALIEIDKYFSNIKEKNEMIYSYHGNIIRINSELYCDSLDTNVIYNSRDLVTDTIYSSTIKSINTTTENNRLKQRLNIVKVKCNDNLFIDSIELTDIYDIEKYEITIGGRVNFKVECNKAVICK